MNPFSRDAIEGSLPERFEVQVRRLPGQIALRSDGLEWTYQELNRCANRLARQFLPPTPAESLPVPLLIGHGALEIMALLAVLKSGRAYVALDPLTPLPRLRQILADVGTDLVLTCRAHADLAARLAPRVVELPGAAALQADARDDENLGVGIQPGALASLIYTSGSTGTPKGVMRSHRASMHRCWLFQQTHRADAGVCISHLFSVGFVAAEVDVYGALLNGATLCCYPVRERGIGPLAEWLAAEQITVFHPPTALFRRFLESLEQPLHLPKLRALCLAGEPVFRQDVERIHQRLPGCTIVHRFASSETSLLTQFILPPDESCPDAIVPVGVPAPDKTISLLNAHGCEVPAGEIGEIVVESHYLSPGYWRRPELTAEKFIPDQHGLIRYRTGDLGRFTAGRLYHLGRLDAQLKIRGYRVEPQEVEAALLGLGALKEAAVFGRPDAAGEMQLVGVVVPKVPETWSDSETRRLLAEQLPPALIPSHFAVLPALPITPNGKVDRQRLAAEHGAAANPPTAASEPGASDTTEVIARVWAKILRRDRVGLDENFFHLGGDSLSGIQLLAAVEKALRRKLPTSGLYRLSTVREMARIIAATDGEEQVRRIALSASDYRSMLAVVGSGKIPAVRPGSLLTVLNQGGSQPPLFWCFNAPDLEMPPLAAQLGDQQPVYGMYSGGGQLPNTDGILDGIVDHYAEEILGLCPGGPFVIGGNCRGADVARRLARRLAALGKEISCLCLMEYFDPDLYAYPGRLLLLYGRESDLRAYEPFRWGQPGWDRAFRQVPEVDWIPGAHAQFFNAGNVERLAGRIRAFLHGPQPVSGLRGVHQDPKVEPACPDAS